MKLRRDFVSSHSIRQDLQQFYNKPITRVSIELVVSILTVILFALFALRPTLLTMSELLREIEEKRELDQQLGNKIAALATAQREFLIYENQIQSLDQAILRQASLEEVAYYLEYLLADSGLLVQRMSFGQIPILVKPPSEDMQTLQNLTLTQYQAQIVVEGELEAVRTFMTRLEEVKPLFSITGWSVSPTLGEDRLPVEAAINIGVYIYSSPFDALGTGTGEAAGTSGGTAGATGVTGGAR